jgi:hypothetical protein
MPNLADSLISGGASGGSGGAASGGSNFSGFPASNAAFADFGGAVSDLFAADADRSKATGDRLEAQNYGLAASLAGQNEQFEVLSTSIKEAQQDRSIYQTTSGQRADEANAGFAESGSALDLLRDSASQGALQKAVTSEQGLITEAGYREQQESYLNMQNAANVAADAADKAATGMDITAAIKGAAGIAQLAILAA